MGPARLREPLQSRKRVLEQLPADLWIDVEPPSCIGELERARRLVARRLVRPAEHGPHRRPPGLRLAHLRVRDLGLVPRKALTQVRREPVGGVPMPRLLGVEGLGEQDAPPGLASPVGERAVEVPDQEPRAAHPISWNTTRVTSAPRAPPYATSSDEWIPDSTRVCATSTAMISVSAETTKRWLSPTRYVMATQPAKAIAAWPDGSPPRSGVPRPRNAFVPITSRIVSTSAISVTTVGRSRSRSSPVPAELPI